MNGGLGALAYDSGRNALWAGWGNGQPANVYLIPLDSSKNAQPKQLKFTAAGALACDLDDGLAYDRQDDSLYISDDCATTIHHYSVSGTELDTFPWAGTGCYNSGLAVGGSLLYQGSNGCTHIWAVDKASKAHQFDFSSPGTRDEDLECDSHTFPGKTAMWSKDAYNSTAYAFEIPLGSCNSGGVPLPPTDERRIFYVQGWSSQSDCTHSFAIRSWLDSYLTSQPWIKNRVHIAGFSMFSYSGAYEACGGGIVVPKYTKDDTCGRDDELGLGIAGFANRLQQQIEAQSGDTKVTIVAHSMGGLIAAYLVGSQPDWAKQHIASVVTFDSPLRGVPKWYIALTGGLIVDVLGLISPCDLLDPSTEDAIDSSLPFFPDPLLDAAKGAAKIVPFYTIDATGHELGVLEFIPGDRATLTNARATMKTAETHSESWDHSSLAKKQFVGCAVILRHSCTSITSLATEGLTTETLMTIGPPATSFSITSHFGSIIRMTLVDPNGTVYGPDGAGDVAQYAVDGSSETYVINHPVTGDWIVKLNGIEVPSGSEDVDLVIAIERPELQPPVARPGGPYSGVAGTPVTFDASASTDDGSITLYEWDWNNDGLFDESSVSALIQHTFSGLYMGQVGLRVTDNDGLTDVAFADASIAQPMPGILKTPDLANLWLCQPVATCVNASSGIGQRDFSVVLDQPVTTMSPKGEPQTVGSFEFEVRYDRKLVNVSVTPGSLFLVDGVLRSDVGCATTPGQGFVQFRCNVKGKTGVPIIGPGTLAVVHVTPTADVYSMLIASQENGIATQLINQDCGLSDLQGHAIQMGSCDNADVTLRYLEGDVNADCAVDVRDQQEIAFRWDSHTGQLLYNSRFDLEPAAPKLGDGDIDGHDLQVVFGRHGSTCGDPQPPQPPVNPTG